MVSVSDLFARRRVVFAEILGSLAVILLTGGGNGNFGRFWGGGYCP